MKFRFERNLFRLGRTALEVSGLDYLSDGDNVKAWRDSIRRLRLEGSTRGLYYHGKKINRWWYSVREVKEILGEEVE